MSPTFSNEPHSPLCQCIPCRGDRDAIEAAREERLYFPRPERTYAPRAPWFPRSTPQDDFTPVADDETGGAPSRLPEKRKK